MKIIISRSSFRFTEFRFIDVSLIVNVNPHYKVIFSLCEPGFAPSGGEDVSETELRRRSRSAVEPAGEHEDESPRVGR